MNQEIIITSDGSKSKYKSGGAGIIVDSFGKCVILESNPGFWKITSISSHRSKIFGVLSTLLFINEYFRYFMINFNYQVNYFCDNFEVVNKILQLNENSTADNDAVYLLKHCLSSMFNV